MSRAVGVQKQQEAQKAKALWKMKAAKDAGEEYYDLTREDNILRRNKTRLAHWAGIEVQIPSLFEDNSASWVRIVIGVDEYVTESMLTETQEDVASGKPTAKARPRKKPTATLTYVS